MKSDSDLRHLNLPTVELKVETTTAANLCDESSSYELFSLGMPKYHDTYWGDDSDFVMNSVRTIIFPKRIFKNGFKS